jgi:hypothetical protein
MVDATLQIGGKMSSRPEGKRRGGDKRETACSRTMRKLVVLMVEVEGYRRAYL